MRFVFLFSYVSVFYQNMCLNNEVSNSKEIVYEIFSFHSVRNASNCCTIIL